MRIGDIDITPVQPTRTGLYLVRSKDATFTGVGMLIEKDGLKVINCNGRCGLADNFDCFGPLLFPAQADKVHTTYKIDSAFNWPKPEDFGAPGRS